MKRRASYKGRMQLRPFYFYVETAKLPVWALLAGSSVTWFVCAVILAITAEWLIGYVDVGWPVFTLSLILFFLLCLCILVPAITKLVVAAGREGRRVASALDLAYLYSAVVATFALGGAISAVDASQIQAALAEPRIRVDQTWLNLGRRSHSEAEQECAVRPHRSLCSALLQLAEIGSQQNPYEETSFAAAESLIRGIARGEKDLARDLLTDLQTVRTWKGKLLVAKDKAQKISAIKSRAVLFCAFLLAAGLCLRLCKGMLDHQVIGVATTNAPP